MKIKENKKEMMFLIRLINCCMINSYKLIILIKIFFLDNIYKKYKQKNK
jgi:hypothetical protein